MELSAGGQDSHQHGQVVEGPRLFQMSGSQIDGDPADGKGEAAVLDGGPDPFPGLADGGVGQADYREGGQTAGQITFCGHRVTGHTVQTQ